MTGRRSWPFFPLTSAHIGNPAINFFGSYELVQYEPEKWQKLGKSPESPKQVPYVSRKAVFGHCRLHHSQPTRSRKYKKMRLRPLAKMRRVTARAAMPPIIPPAIGPVLLL